jgi:hypothetical protein
VDHDYPISAIYRDTPRSPMGVLSLPGEYSVKLTVDGKSYTQPLTLKMDPRVKTPLAGLQQQFALAQRITTLMHRTFEAAQQASTGKAELEGRNRALAALLAIVEGADSASTPAMVNAVDEIERKK